MECREVTPEQVGFPGARLIARLKRRVRRHGQKSTETVYLISSLTLEQLDARGWLKLKRGYWVIESRLHHALDVSLDEDRSRVRQPNAALVLGLFRRLVVSKCGTGGHRTGADQKDALGRAPLPAALRASGRRPAMTPSLDVRRSPAFLAPTSLKT